MDTVPAFLFDMDGVIIDSTAVHAQAWDVYLRRHDVVLPDLGMRLLGKHNDEIVREFFAGRTLTDAEVFGHGAAKEAVYRELMQPQFNSKLVPGVDDFIRQNCSFPMALATNAEPANVDFVLSLSGLRPCFQTLVSGHDVARPKPFPDVYLHAAERLGVPPEDCIVFEDSPTGVQAGLAAGMKVVALLTTVNQFDKVELTIRDFRDPRLQEWLGSVV